MEFWIAYYLSAITTLLLVCEYLLLYAYFDRFKIK